MFRYPFDNLEANASFTVCASLDKPYARPSVGDSPVWGQRYDPTTIRTLNCPCPEVTIDRNGSDRFRGEKLFEQRGGSLRELSDHVAVDRKSTRLNSSHLGI